MPQTEYTGKDSINNLKSTLSRHKPNSIFLATGKASYEKSGAKSILNKILNGCGVIN